MKDLHIKVRDEAFDQMSNVKPISLSWHSKSFAKLDSPEMDIEDPSHTTPKLSWEEGRGKATKVQSRRKVRSKQALCRDTRGVSLTECKGHSTYCKHWF